MCHGVEGCVAMRFVFVDLFPTEKVYMHRSLDVPCVCSFTCALGGVDEHVGGAFWPLGIHRSESASGFPVFKSWGLR